MTLQQCRYLIEIARHNSLTKAAEELFVTQPSISKAIRELENDLEITILDRTNRGVSFTPEGLELLSYAQMLIAQEQNIRWRFSKRQRDAALSLSISSQHFSFATEAAAQLIQSLSPLAYELAFFEEKAADVIAHVASGASALGVLSVSSLNREWMERCFLEQSLVFTPLATLPEHVFLGKHHPLVGCKAISLEQLSDYPCLTYRKNDAPLHLAETSPNGNPARQIVYVQDRATMDDLLAHTNGYNLGTGCMSAGFISPDIVSIPLDMPWQVHIGYIRKSDQLLSAEALKYIEFLSDALSRALPIDKGGLPYEP